MKTKQWWVELMDAEGVIKSRPVFLVNAETHQEATDAVRRNLDMEEYGRYTLEAQIVEFGEMGGDVAYL